MERGDLPSVPPDPMKGIIYIGKDGRAYSTGRAARFEAVDYEYRRQEKYGEET